MPSRLSSQFIGKQGKAQRGMLHEFVSDLSITYHIQLAEPLDDESRIWVYVFTSTANKHSGNGVFHVFAPGRLIPEINAKCCN